MTQGVLKINYRDYTHVPGKYYFICIQPTAQRDEEKLRKLFFSAHFTALNTASHTEQRSLDRWSILAKGLLGHPVFSKLSKTFRE